MAEYVAEGAKSGGADVALMTVSEADAGVLDSDVLLFGWVDGSVPVPHKRKMLVEHIREYLELLKSDPDFETEVLPIGEGLAVSVKKT